MAQKVRSGFETDIFRNRSNHALHKTIDLDSKKKKKSSEG